MNVHANDVRVPRRRFSYTQYLSSLRPFFLYFHFTVFFLSFFLFYFSSLCLSLIVSLSSFFTRRCYQTLSGLTDHPSTSFLSLEYVVRKKRKWKVVWGIVRVCLYRFFEKRFRLQYSIRRPPVVRLNTRRYCLRKRPLYPSDRYFYSERSCKVFRSAKEI